MLVLTSNLAWAAELTLTTDTTLSTEGYFVISWTAEPESTSPILLQQSPSENFGTTITREYNLPANSSITITGLDNGHYYFRAMTAGSSQFSNTVMVEVAHHSLQRALLIFAIGLVLFTVLVITIVKGNRRYRVAESAATGSTSSAGSSSHGR